MLTETLTIRLTAEELRAIKLRALAEERSAGDVVRREALRPWLRLLDQSDDRQPTPPAPLVQRAA